MAKVANVTAFASRPSAGVCLCPRVCLRVSVCFRVEVHPQAAGSRVEEMSRAPLKEEEARQSAAFALRHVTTGSAPNRKKSFHISDVIVVVAPSSHNIHVYWFLKLVTLILKN